MLQVEKGENRVEFELYIKFYKSPSGKQNMWIEKDGMEGTRYEVDDTKDVEDILRGYMGKIIINNLY